MTNRVTVAETRHVVAVTSAGSVTVTDDNLTEVVVVGAMGPQGPVATAATAAEMLAALITVDGAGSGLDADLLDGQHGAYYATAASLAGYQPLDSDLTAIAALTTTAYGRGLLALADAAALRTAAGLVIGTDVQAQDAELAAIAGLVSAADRLPYFTGSGTASLATFTAAGRALVDDADAATQRTTLGLAAIASSGSASDLSTGTVPNTRLDGELSAIAGLTSAADTVPYYTGSGTAALATFTAAGRALVDDTDAAAQRTTLGLGSIATQAANSVSITGGSVTGITDLAVADGGTGASDAATARTNLGVDAAGTAASAVATHAALTATHGIAGAIVGTTDSQTLTNKTLTTPTLTLKQSTTPTPTVEGDIQWDTDDNRIVVGDGAATKTFSDDSVNRARANHTGTQTLSTISDAGTIASQNANNVTITGGSVTGITDLAVADGGTGASTASGARTNLGLVIGTDVQAYDGELAAIAGLTSAADRLPYFTGAGTAALATFTAAGRALVDDADAAAQRTTLVVPEGANVSTTNLRVGSGTLASRTSGDYNTAVGYNVQTALTSGNENTGMGYNAQLGLTTGANNFGLGRSAQQSLTTGGQNLGIGGYAQFALSTGSDNTSIGVLSQAAGSAGMTGTDNVAIGRGAQYNMTTGVANVAIGNYAGNTTTTAHGQTCVGHDSGDTAAQSWNVTAVGLSARVSGDYSTAVGASTSATGSGSVAIGTNSSGTGASTSVSNEIKMGTSSHTVNVPGTLNLTGATASTVGAAGGASALPATPTGYVVVKIGGTDYKMPYYAT